MDKDHDRPTLGESKGNQAARIGASALGAIPVLGPIIQATVTETIPNVRLERIEAYLQHLERRLDEATLGEQLKDERQLDLFEEGMWQSARAVSDERKERVANLVVNGLSAPELDAARSRHWLRVLNQLGDEEIAILLDEFQWQTSYPEATDEEQGQRVKETPNEALPSRFLLSAFGLMKQHATWGGGNVVQGVTPAGEDFLRAMGLLGD
ncbi:MAG: hypothetical protein JJ959_11460 [Nisaea sp.]|uniref:hypothetical protein n=1 Tax=Nisaea sp. TaxID=2024842 RepID=UPI001B11ABFD|nr:hypothetical protein [Nisaea sp.]MBO6561150.1 hypothetical protein [Nisaea sp.]